MSAVNYVLYFLAGMATLLIGIPQQASDNKLNREKLPDFVFGLSRPVLFVLNLLALMPGIAIVVLHGLFSFPALVAFLGIVLGAVPVLSYLMIPPAKT